MSSLVLHLKQPFTLPCDLTLRVIDLIVMYVDFDTFVTLDELDPTQYIEYWWRNDELVECECFLQPAGDPGTDRTDGPDTLLTPMG